MSPLDPRVHHDDGAPTLEVVQALVERVHERLDAAGVPREIEAGTLTVLGRFDALLDMRDEERVRLAHVSINLGKSPATLAVTTASGLIEPLLGAPGTPARRAAFEQAHRERGARP